MSLNFSKADRIRLREDAPYPFPYTEKGLLRIKNLLLDDIDRLSARVEELEGALGATLDAVDYTNGACRINEMVGAVLPSTLIATARQALKGAKEVKP